MTTLALLLIGAGLGIVCFVSGVFWIGSKIEVFR